MSLCVRIHIATMQLCVPNEQNKNEKSKIKQMQQQQQYSAVLAAAKGNSD